MSDERAERIASSVEPSRAWGAVPVWVSCNREISGDAVRLFALISAKYVNRPGYTAASPRLVDLANELGVSERSVRRWRDELLTVRAIDVVKRPNLPSVYVVVGIGADSPLSDRTVTTAADGVDSPVHTNRTGLSTPTTYTKNSEKTANGSDTQRRSSVAGGAAEGRPNPTRSYDDIAAELDRHEREKADPETIARLLAAARTAIGRPE